MKGDSLAAQLRADIERLRPARLVMTAPGDRRVLQALKAVAEDAGLPLEIREDRHFFCRVRGPRRGPRAAGQRRGYIARMSPHCKGCRCDPALRAGERACPFTTLYWDHLMRREAMLAKNPRMALQVKNLGRMSATQRQQVVERAVSIRRGEVGTVEAAAVALEGSHG